RRSPPGPAGGSAGRALSSDVSVAEAFGTTWSKHYCSYERGSRVLSLMPFNQINVKTVRTGDSGCHVCTLLNIIEVNFKRFFPLDKCYCRIYNVYIMKM
ncbi:jg26019, partial [Pararge aegeria aegeria]